MTIHVNIGEAKTRLSQLVAAAVRGEEVVLAKAGAPQVRLVPVESATEAERQARGERRRAAIGMWRDKFAEMPDIDVRALKMTEAEVDERYAVKFGDID